MRKIDDDTKELIDFLDEKLKNNLVAKEALEQRMPRKLLAEAAKACIGQREKTNNNDGWFVELVQKTVNGKASNEAWCMCFVQSMIAYVEFKLKIKSPLLATEHCMTLWSKTDEKHYVKNSPLIGAVAIWNYKGTSNGHTGILIANEPDKYILVEGNTTKGLSGDKIVREGHGVYLTERPKTSVDKMILKGFIKPF